MLFGGFLHLLQNEGRDLLRGIVLALGLDPGVAGRALDDVVGHHALVLLHQRIVVVSSDQTLDGEEGVGGVGHGLALGGLANEALTVLEEGHDRGGGPNALGVLDHPGRLAVHDRDAGIGRSEVDADDLAHDGSQTLLFGGPRLRSLVAKHPPFLRPP